MNNVTIAAVFTAEFLRFLVEPANGKSFPHVDMKEAFRELGQFCSKVQANAYWVCETRAATCEDLAVENGER